MSNNSGYLNSVQQNSMKPIQFATEIENLTNCLYKKQICNYKDYKL